MVRPWRACRPRRQPRDPMDLRNRREKSRMPSPGPATTTTSATSRRAWCRCQVRQVQVHYLEVLADHDAGGVPDGAAAEGEEEPVGEEHLGTGQSGVDKVIQGISRLVMSVHPMEDRV